LLRSAFTGGLVAAMMPSSRVAMTRAAGPYRIELDLLPAEPFATPAQVASGAATEGMVALGRALPVPMMRANHHLVAHVYDASGRALTAAGVRITYQRSGDAPATVSIVRMEAVGKGPQSTHYGNNVQLAAGAYQITVTANGHAATFHLTAK
jgi:hypothetical protein